MNHNLIDDIRCCLDLAPISTQGEDPQAQLTMIGTKCLIKAKTIAAQHAVLAAAAAPDLRVAASFDKRLLIGKL